MAINKQALAERRKINTKLYGDAETQKASQEKEFREWAEKEGLVKADSIPVGANTVIEVAVERLKPSPLNKFNAVSTDKHQEMLESIKKNGIIVPLQVRPITDTSDYEILAGHNRTNIAKEIGLETVPVIICDVDDIEAIKIIYATNQEQRDKISDLELGLMYRAMFETLSKQGARTDLTLSYDGTKLKKEEKGTSGQQDHKLNNESQITSGQQDHKLKNLTSAEIVADKFGVGEKTVRRKIRLTYLSDALYKMYEGKSITQEVAEHLSYLTEKEQFSILGELSKVEMNIDTFKTLKNESKKRQKAGEDSLNIDEICSMLTYKESKVKPVKTSGSFKFDFSIFPTEINKPKDRNEYLIKAVEFAQANGFTLSKDEE